MINATKDILEDSNFVQSFMNASATRPRDYIAPGHPGCRCTGAPGVRHRGMWKIFFNMMSLDVAVKLGFGKVDKTWTTIRSTWWIIYEEFRWIL